MRAVMVKILLITEKLPLQICGRPKESLIQELPAMAVKRQYLAFGKILAETHD
jgi:hypothetical protein